MASDKWLQWNLRKSRYLVPGTWYVVPGTRYLVPDTRNQVPGNVVQGRLNNIPVTDVYFFNQGPGKHLYSFLVVARFGPRPREGGGRAVFNLSENLR